MEDRFNGTLIFQHPYCPSIPTISFYLNNMQVGERISEKREK